MVTYLRHPAGQWRQIGGLLRLNDRLRRNSNVTATGRYWPQVAVQISMEHAVMMTKRGEESVARGRHVKFILAANIDQGIVYWPPAWLRTWVEIESARFS